MIGQWGSRVNRIAVLGVLGAYLIAFAAFFAAIALALASWAGAATQPTTILKEGNNSPIGLEVGRWVRVSNRVEKQDGSKGSIVSYGNVLYAPKLHRYGFDVEVLFANKPPLCFFLGLTQSELAKPNGTVSYQGQVACVVHTKVKAAPPAA